MCVFCHDKKGDEPRSLDIPLTHEWMTLEGQGKMSVLMFIIIKWLRKVVKNKQGVGNEIADHFGKKFKTVANKNHGTMAAGTRGVHVQ